MDYSFFALNSLTVAIDYFMKWAEAMPIVKSDGETVVHFVFNKIIT